MKNLLIKLGLWEEMGDIEQETIAFFKEAKKHYCEKCNRWFEKYVGKLAHDRAAHEGVFKKDRSQDAS